jgi:hypothetical protein
MLGDATGPLRCGMPSRMDWSSTVSAFVGAAIPGGIALGIYFADRRARHAQAAEDREQRALERQWLDAEVVGEAARLLADIDPDRRSMSLTREEGAEAKLWEELDARRVEVQRRLLVMGAGHPQQAVRELADQLATDLHNAANASKWQVNDMLRHRGDGEWMEVARTQHREATGTLGDLKLAVQEVNRIA